MTLDEGILDRLESRANAPMSALPRPFLRWAGSKQKVLRSILPYLPLSYDRFFEPFLGSGSLFFLLQPERAVLADSNGDLIETYRAIRDNPRRILDYLNEMNPQDEDQFYKVRGRRQQGRYQRAADFIYLNRAAWNGLYRVNSKGEFNVPFGAAKTRNIIDPQHLLSCSAALAERGVELLVCDFEEAVSGASERDFAFFDPPYVTGHNNNGFVDYNEKLFSWEDQSRLADVAAGLANRDVSVVVTNAQHSEVVALYPSFQVDEYSRTSTLASKKRARGQVHEAIFHRIRKGEIE